MYLGKGRLLVFFGAVMFFYCFMVDYVVAMALFVFVIPMGVVSVIGDRRHIIAIFPTGNRFVSNAQAFSQLSLRPTLLYMK